MNVAMVFWVTFLVVLSGFNIILTNIVSPLLIYEKNKDSQVLQFYEQNAFVWFTAVDFLKGITMLYLFYQQGKFNIRRMIQQRKESNSANKVEVPSRILGSLISQFSSDNINTSGKVEEKEIE